MEFYFFSVDICTTFICVFVIKISRCKLCVNINEQPSKHTRILEQIPAQIGVL